MEWYSISFHLNKLSYLCNFSVFFPPVMYSLLLSVLQVLLTLTSVTYLNIYDMYPGERPFKVMKNSQCCKIMHDLMFTNLNYFKLHF